MKVDKTDYARSIGYTGTRSVIVWDGEVISHGNVGWITFCSNIRNGRALNSN